MLFCRQVLRLGVLAEEEGLVSGGVALMGSDQQGQLRLLL